MRQNYPASAGSPRSPVRQLSRQIRLACPPLSEQSLEQLRHWHALGLKRWRAAELADGPESGSNWLEIKLELARRLLARCDYCVHDCRVNRLAGETGYCRLDATPRISGSYLHWGEEAPLSPTWALFFSGCTMHCVYCHNWRETFDLAAGAELDVPKLARQLYEAKGSYRTLSLIGGTPETQLHAVLELVCALDGRVDVPLVFNNNATLSASGLALMEGVVDIYLPDYKHGNDSCAWRLTKIADYNASFRRNLQAYLDQGAAVLVRHLVVPGHLDCCTRPILETLARDFPGVAVNVMHQYRPMYRAAEKPGLDRPLAAAEQARVTAWVGELNLRTI